MSGIYGTQSTSNYSTANPENNAVDGSPALAPLQRR